MAVFYDTFPVSEVMSSIFMLNRTGHAIYHAHKRLKAKYGFEHDKYNI